MSGNNSYSGDSIRVQQLPEFKIKDAYASPVLPGIGLRPAWMNNVPPLLLIVATLLTLWGAAHHRSHLNDDTYITLTYARSLAAGEGWRYNGGTEALGTTTPLFALVVATLAWLFAPIPLEWLAVGFSSLCWLGIGWLFFLGHRTFGLSQGAGAILALVVLLQGGWLFGSLGMEAAFLLFGLTLAVWVAGRGYPLMGGLLSALLFLIRPEGLAMVPLVGGWILWQKRVTWRTTLPRFVLGAALPLFLWVSYAWPRFGNVLPNSALAKVGQGAFWPGKPFVERLFVEWLPAHAVNYGLSPTLSLLWLLTLLGLFYALRQGKVLLLFAAWGLLFLAGYYLLGAPGYWWYMLPVLFLIQLFSGLGIICLVQQPQPGIRVLGVFVAVLFLTLSGYRQLQVVLDHSGDARAPGYLAVAHWLRQNSAPDDHIAVVEIGYLGYFTDNRIVDLAGLVEPAFTENASHLALSHNFWRAEPEYFLYSSTFDFLLTPIIQDARFTARYQRVAEFPRAPAPPLILYRRMGD